MAHFAGAGKIRTIGARYLFCLLACAAVFADPAANLFGADDTHYEWIEDGGSYRSPKSIYQTRHGNECFRRILIPNGNGDDKIRGVIVWDAERHYHPNELRNCHIHHTCGLIPATPGVSVWQSGHRD